MILSMVLTLIARYRFAITSNEPAPGLFSPRTTATSALVENGPPKNTGSTTFFDGSCSGNRLDSERRVGLLRITPMWPPLAVGLAMSTLWRYSGSRKAGAATRNTAWSALGGVDWAAAG